MILHLKKAIESRRLKIALASLLAITVIRETGVINVSLYRQQSAYDIESSCHESNNSAAFDRSSYDDTPHENITQTRIAVLEDDDTLFYRDGHSKCIQLIVDRLDTGPLWLPLIKPGHLDAQLHYRCHGGWTKRQGSHIVVINSTLSGDIHISGSTTIYGLCSYNTALHLLKQDAANKAVAVIENRLQALEDQYESSSAASTGE